MFLLDDGADINVVSRKFALQYGLPFVKEAQLPKISSFQGREGFCYGAHRVRIRLADSQGQTKETVGIFYAMDMAGADVILGRPWRRKQAVIVDSGKDQWRYGCVPKGVRIREPRDFVRDLKGEKRVFVVSLRAIQALEGTSSDVPSEFRSFSKVFEYKDVAKLKGPEGAEHAIELEEGKRPPFQPLYNLSVKELEVLREYLRTAEANGWIRRSASEAGAPILFVPKKDGSLRLCVDYRGLNAITVKNRHPLPLISETLDRLGRAKWFTKLDLKDAYHRIPIRRGDEWKTAFRTRYGHFEYLVMPFGLTNAPATFQAYINRALAGLVDESCVVYLDDILVYSDTREEHVRHVREVLTRLEKFALYANLKKCYFFRQEVEFLGFIVGVAGVTMDPSRVSAVRDWPRPRTYQEVQVFLGFANFYRRFIRHYSKIVKPLTGLLKGSQKGKKNGPLVWGDCEEQAFHQVKQAFTNASVLRHYDPALRVRVESDASGFALAAVLSQLFDAEWHPIAFWSRKMIPAECNYETHDQELLAVVSAFKQWRHYLEGASHAVQVLTDHANLRGFTKVKQLNGRQARWATFLAPFDFVIEHQSGKKNPADAPSRRSDYAGENQAVTHLLPTLQQKLAAWSTEDLTKEDDTPLIRRIQATCAAFADECGAGTGGEASGAAAVPMRVAVAATREEAAYEYPSSLTLELIRVLQGKDPKTQGRIAELRNGVASDSPWTLQQDILYRNGAVYVPKDEAVCTQLLRMHHDDALAGHFGRAKTLELLTRKFTWDEVSQDVNNYVKSCAVCQRTKARRHRPYGELASLPLPSRPWQEISMDLITDLPPSKRGDRVYDAILVIVDRYCKMHRYLPITKTCTAAELATLLRDEVVVRYGMPQGIVSDRGSLFTSAFWSDFCFKAHVKRKLSTAFHPQTDGQTERANQGLEQYLRCFCSENQDDWAELLPQAEFAVNNSENHALRMSPFRVLYGWDPELNTLLPEARDELQGERVPAAAELGQESQRNARGACGTAHEVCTHTTFNLESTRHECIYTRFTRGFRTLVLAINRRTSIRKCAHAFCWPYQSLQHSMLEALSCASTSRNFCALFVHSLMLQCHRMPRSSSVCQGAQMPRL